LKHVTFGRGNGFHELQRLQQLTQRGVNIAVEFGGGQLISELEFGSSASTEMHSEALYRKVIDDLKQGKAVAISRQAALQYLSRRLRVAPVGVIKEREDKYRVIHDLSTEKVGKASVNATTDFDDAPPCGCGTVLAALLLRL
jgi:hypothetical protein